jgi:hypothetical protein
MNVWIVFTDDSVEWRSEPLEVFSSEEAMRKKYPDAIESSSLQYGSIMVGHDHAFVVLPVGD